VARWKLTRIRRFTDRTEGVHGGVPYPACLPPAHALRRPGRLYRTHESHHHWRLRLELPRAARRRRDLPGSLPD
jgi:hypothetical protein